MNKDEYIKKLQNCNAADSVDDYSKDYNKGLTDTLVYAINLAKKLDEPKKVVIPQFVADWIKEYSKNFAPIGIVYQILNRSLEKDVQNHWRNDESNQKLLLDAIANGYEVKKEKKYLVRIKGICQEGEWLNCEVGKGELYFDVDSRLESEVNKTSFTKGRL